MDKDLKDMLEKEGVPVLEAGELKNMEDNALARCINEILEENLNPDLINEMKGAIYVIPSLIQAEMFGEKKFEDAVNMLIKKGRIDVALVWAYTWFELFPDSELASAMCDGLRENLVRNADDGVDYEKNYIDVEKYHIANHVARYVGMPEMTFDVDGILISVVMPSEDNPYFTLFSNGIGAKPMNVPDEAKDMVVPRCELVINVPAYLNITVESFAADEFGWVVKHFQSAKDIIENDGYLGVTHSVGSIERLKEVADEFTGYMLLRPGCFEEGFENCHLGPGKEVAFLQGILLYPEELECKVEEGLDSILEKMPEEYLVESDPNRANVVTEPEIVGRDDILVYIDRPYKTALTKGIDVDPISIYNHPAIYLRWAIENDLMNNWFKDEYKLLIEMAKHNPEEVDFRGLIKDDPKFMGRLLYDIFNLRGIKASECFFSKILEFNGKQLPFPAVVDEYSYKRLGITEEESVNSEIYQDESFLFVPYDEVYYQDMAEVLNQILPMLEEYEKENVAEKNPKSYFYGKKFKRLYEPGAGPEYCRVTDAIFLEGKEPYEGFVSARDSFANFDNGWKFRTKDDSESDDLRLRWVEINSLANIDPTILELMERTDGVAVKVAGKWHEEFAGSYGEDIIEIPMEESLAIGDESQGVKEDSAGSNAKDMENEDFDLDALISNLENQDSGNILS